MLLIINTYKEVLFVVNNKLWTADLTLPLSLITVNHKRQLETRHDVWINSKQRAHHFNITKRWARKLCRASLDAVVNQWPRPVAALGSCDHSVD